jgi:hypothetical protein
MIGIFILGIKDVFASVFLERLANFPRLCNRDGFIILSVK